MVPGTGLEPVQPCGRGILSPLCLPISPPGQKEASRYTEVSTTGRKMEARVGIEPAYAELQSAA
jgi:hypothetical protein